ncbi:MAG: cell filamentation protein Fic [Gammaproteobacteria bacterium]|nr:cell filamentation protein Fic [Gammaproteobacteria bacterium]
MEVFDALGFRWDRSTVAWDVPVHTADRVCFHFLRMLPEFVWNEGVLESNPFTYSEVQTLMEGVTIGGRRISDQTQILNLARSARRLLTLVRTGQFAITKPIFTELHALAARHDALEWGHFRGEGEETLYTPEVSLGERGRYRPSPTVAGARPLQDLFDRGVQALDAHVPRPFEKALAFFLFAVLQQFFFDGNRRAADLMMNGILMSHGINAIRVDASRMEAFNEQMQQFFVTQDGSAVMALLTDCHPEAAAIHAANPPIPDLRAQVWEDESGAGEEAT